MANVSSGCSLTDCQGFVFDVDGVLCRGDDPIPRSAEAIERLRRGGKKVIFISNNSTKSREDYLAKFERLGIPLERVCPPIVDLFAIALPGAWWCTLTWPDNPSKTIIEKNPQYVEWAHARGLVVHPYTFRKDQLPPQYPTLADELKQFYYKYDVDGVFTDFVDIAVSVLAEHGK